jgi:hypothetical protein
MDWGAAIGNLAQLGASIYSQERQKSELRKRSEQDAARARKDALAELEMSRVAQLGGPTSDLSAMKFIRDQQRQQSEQRKQIDNLQMFSPQQLVGMYRSLKLSDSPDTSAARDSEPMTLSTPKGLRGDGYTFEPQAASGGDWASKQLDTPQLLQDQDDYSLDHRKYRL